MVLAPPTDSPISSYGIDPEALTLVNMLDRLLEKVVGVYEQQGIPLPARRYWMLSGRAPEDCAQLVVTFVQAYLGAPGDQAADTQQCDAPRTGVFNITVTRDHPASAPSSQPPSGERITEASKWGAVDAYTLMWALNDLSEMADGYPGPGVIATVNVQPPGGKVQTTVLNLSMVIS